MINDRVGKNSIVAKYKALSCDMAEEVEESNTKPEAV
jgi:hypothetical protein